MTTQNEQADRSIPPIESYLPDLMRFVTFLVQEAESGKLSNWSIAAKHVKAFFTPSMMDKVNTIIPGWQTMAAYEDNVTLIHVLLVFTALLQCPEYQNSTTPQQAILKWIVLFHDLGKTVIKGERDFTHGFRSARLAAQQLPRLGFAKNPDFDAYIEAWASLTANAIIPSIEAHQPIQDNRQLPSILAGIEQLFGHNTPATLIVKTVLLHMSINVVSQWPQAAPLTEQEICQYVDADLFPLLKVMMLVDNDAWAFFDPLIKDQYRTETLAAFEHIKPLIIGFP